MASRTVALETTKTATERAIRGRRVDTWGIVFQSMLLLSLLICLAFIFVLVAQVLGDGWSTLQDRNVNFLTSDLSRLPERAGIHQAIIGTLTLAVIVAVVAFPLGVATAVYLEEYAPDNKFWRFVTLNIRNLAGVPSVVYGLLGLAVFVQLAGTDISQEGGGLTGGRSVISGGLTLAILVLPIVIITASEALRAVPNSLREGGYGVGATKWEVVRSLVMPNAASGILTGTVLALSRAIGETAPLILVGAFFGTFFTTGTQGFVDQLRGTYTALPMVVFQWASDSQTEFKRALAPAAILVLLAITVLANMTAILLRNHYEKKW
jgi:phosphate transport system permease protein